MRLLAPALAASALLAPFASSGCTPIGPATIPRDRFDYSSAITESWKRQTLLNIVKLRYLDPPIFVDVGQIVAGYTLETGISGSAGLSTDPAGAAIGGEQAAIGGSMRFTDRPTVTYVPMTGNKFVRALMTPLPVEALFQAISAGWPADGILGSAAISINGLDNARASLDGITPPDLRLVRVLQLLREIQLSGAIGLRVAREGPLGLGGTKLVVRRRDVAPEIAEKTRELRELLRLDPAADEFSLAFGAVAKDDKEIAVVSRSVLHIMTTMSMGVDVPVVDVQEGRAAPGLQPDDSRGRLIRVKSSDSSPADAYVVVRYRERYYWIDDRDLASKRAFAFMMMLFTMSDPATAENAPVVTIPA